MRIRTALYVAAIVLAVALPRVAAQDAKSNYMPLKEGNTWTYKIAIMGQNITFVQKVTKIEKKNNQDVASVEVDIMGQNMTEQISSTEKGVFRHSFNGIAVDPPIQVLKLPVKKGDTWESDINVAGQKAKASFKADEEEVTVPAGKHKSVVVSMDTEIMGQKLAIKSWFVAGTGIVKQSFDIGGINGTLELEKAELK